MSRRLRLLIATSHFRDIAGSEVVALEWATLFLVLGYEICLFANSAGGTMAKLAAERLGITPTDDFSQIRPFTYDLIYAQHQVLPLFGYEEAAEDLPATRIVIGRLSRRSFLESGGWAYESALAEVVFANSLLTAKHLLSAGLRTPISVLHNAAPTTFFRNLFVWPPTPR